MEKELKTLKDLNKKVHKNWHPKNKLGAYNDEKCTEDNCSITDFEKELKAEAIKRAKYFNKSWFFCNKEIEAQYWRGRYEEVMEANNLTEEDLK